MKHSTHIILAIAGIGSGQIIDVPVDNQARMDPLALDKMLYKAVSKKIAIYSVVAIIGSTEHGAVDPLVWVLKLRQKYQKMGLSFAVHCDGAWGGYFAACIRENDDLKAYGLSKGELSYVPTMALTPYTKKQLEWFGRADSITIDPHKSGYCPYPAGGLCYRDGRMRYLVTWTSPVVFRGEQESIGVYGVEGSKPGAAAGEWLWLC
jgi:glutamate/tyrosine decarboxylase-like PLP-dependent enzyme